MTLAETVWLVRYSEIFLKSDPVRRKWERVLAQNIVQQLPHASVQRERGRIYLRGTVDPEILKNVFGIVSFSPSWKVPLSDICPMLCEYALSVGLKDAQTFALRVRRQGNHPLSSQEYAREFGSLIRHEFPHLSVNLTTPDREIHIEIRDQDCYLYTDTIPGAGGLPLGVAGTVVALFSGGIDSPVAAWMMMKRGCRIIPVYVAQKGMDIPGARQRAEEVASILSRYHPGLALRIVEDGYLATVTTYLKGTSRERYTCLLCKRRMYRIAEQIAHREGAPGIVTGEALSQVASQTLQNLAILSESVTIPMYRPLIGFDKVDVVRMAEAIGTFAASTRRSYDCPAVPKKPSTQGDLAEIRAIEGDLSSACPLPEI